MVRTTRRQLLAVGGAAALTGCTSDLLSSGDETTTEGSTPRTTEGSTPAETTATATTTTKTPGDTVEEGVAEVLAAIPASVDGSSPSMVRVLGTTEHEDAPNFLLGYGGASQFASQLGIGKSQVDHVVITLYEEQTGIITMTGSFGADEPTISEDLPSTVSTHRADGRFTLAIQGNEKPWKAGMSAAKAALDGDRQSILAVDSVRSLVAPVSASTTALVLPSVPPSETAGTGFGTAAEETPDSLEGLAVGTEVVAERTIELAMVGLFADESSVDREAMSAVTDDLPSGGVENLSYEQDGRLLVATGRKEFEPRPSAGASPDAYFSIRYDAEAGEVILTNRGEASVEASNLTVYVDGETVSGVWDGGTVEVDDIARVAADPFVPVRVEWTDPEDEDVFDYLGEDVAAPRDAFEPSYDPAADEVTITYTGTEAAPTDNVRVEVEDHDAESEERGMDDGRPLSEWTSKLEPGEEFVVEDIQFEDTVVLSVHYEWDRGAMSSSIMHFRASPPGRFYIDQEDGVEVIYVGESSNPAGEYRVSVGGDPAETQFADEYSTLSAEDTIEVSGKPGQTVVVEWVGGDEPIELDTERIRPPVDFEFVRQGETYELTYTAETSWSAESLSIRSRGESTDTQFADSYSTLSKGDSVSLDLGLNEFIEVVWTGAEEPMTVFRAHPRFGVEFELGYADGSATLTYTGKGEWPAEDLAIEVGGSESSASFDGSSVTNGDSVTLPGSIGEEVEVLYTGGKEETELFEETIHPSLSFAFDYDEAAGEMTITAESDTSVDADALSLRVYAEGGPSSPDGWAAEYETVSKGDSITVPVPEKFAAVVIEHEEWDVSEVFEAGESDGE